jgi:hypothetical protein
MRMAASEKKPEKPEVDVKREQAEIRKAIEELKKLKGEYQLRLL